MKKISKEEMPVILPVRRKRMTTLRTQLEQLAIGEGLFLPKEEWNAKSSPSFIVAGIRKKSGYLYEWGFKTDGSGWLFRRLN